VRTPNVQFAAAASARRMLGVGLLIAGMVAALASLWEYAAAARELERIEAEIDAATRAAQPRRAAAAKRGAPRIAEQKLNAINEAIARLNIPWNELFAAFEADQRKEIALLALLPEARKRTLVVQAETVTPRAMIEFVDRLRSAPSFEDAVLVKHERRDQDVGQPYRFAVEVRWKDLP
jgi:hypothetical protein